MAHTPGPWRVGDGGVTVFGPKTDAPAPERICSMPANYAPSENIAANARLIAATPDMLAALEECELWMLERGYTEGVTSRIQNAIRKATQA